MRFYLLLIVAIGILFQSQAQTEKTVDGQDASAKKPDQLGTLEEMGGTDNTPDSLRVVYYSEVMPVFPGGGDSAFYAFVRKNLIYPEDAKSKGIMGTVFIQFIVEKDGSLSSIHVIPGRGISPSCDQAAIDVVSKSPKWTPGKMHDKPVRVQCTKRIKFDMQ
ncbi:energy transducer TonB [Cytophaga aurantiaca]|uniref:energy transducer TonB n=1 Tax=Cytophaga aurantiaca TaxID=29530 RepID=UPI000362F285|nr:energy transducer TonB [Cytophaga aurantiaca]